MNRDETSTDGLRFRHFTIALQIIGLLTVGSIATGCGNGENGETDTGSGTDTGVADTSSDTTSPPADTSDTTTDTADPKDTTESPDTSVADTQSPTDTGSGGDTTDNDTTGGRDTNGGTDTDGGDTTGVEFVDQPLQGPVRGDDWSYSSGSAVVVSGQGGADSLELELYTGTSDPCNVGPANYSDWKVTSRLPAEETRHELQISGGDTQTVKIEKVADTVVLSEGFIEITSLTASKVTGKMAARKNQNTEMIGNFEAIRCDG